MAQYKYIVHIVNIISTGDVLNPFYYLVKSLLIRERNICFSVSGYEKSWSQKLDNMKILTTNLVLESARSRGFQWTATKGPKGITTLGGSGGMLHWEFFVS